MNEAKPQFLAQKLAYLIPLILVALVGLIYSFFDPQLLGNSSSTVENVESADYYVMLSLVEVLPKLRDGSNWDQIDGSAPDVRYEIHWRGLTVFKSSVKNNTLIAKWSNAEIDVRELALSGRKISPDEAIRGARISVKEGETITIRIYDNDSLSSDDVIGEMEIATSDLRLGDRSYKPKDQNFSRMILRVLDMNKPLDLLQ